MKYEILTDEITTITNTEQLQNIINLMYLHSNEFKNIYKKVDEIVKNTKYEHDLKKQHELIDNLNYEHSLSLGLNNMKISLNDELDTDTIQLLENLSNDNLYYLYELYSFKDLAIYLFKDYEINITNEFNIIIDNEHRQIYNITDELDLKPIYERLLKENDILSSDYDKLYFMNRLYADTKEILTNDKFTITEQNLNIIDFENYNKKDKYIIHDLIKGKYNTVNTLNFDYKDLIYLVYEYEDTESINYIINTF